MGGHEFGEAEVAEFDRVVGAEEYWEVSVELPTAKNSEGEDRREEKGRVRTVLRF